MPHCKKYWRFLCALWNQIVFPFSLSNHDTAVEFHWHVALQYVWKECRLPKKRFAFEINHWFVSWLPFSFGFLFTYASWGVLFWSWQVVNWNLRAVAHVVRINCCNLHGQAHVRAREERIEVTWNLESLTVKGEALWIKPLQSWRATGCAGFLLQSCSTRLTQGIS